jgi:outer membrane protein, heavy metal efflux system
MSMRDLALICLILLLISGCHAPPLQTIDQSIAAYVNHPFDMKADSSLTPGASQRPAEGAAPGAAAPNPDGSRPLPPPAGATSPFGALPSPASTPADSAPPTDGVVPSAADASQGLPGSGSRTNGVVLASYAQAGRTSPGQAGSPLSKFELTIPDAIPGSETPLVRLPNDRSKRPEAVAGFFPQLPPLPEEPVPLPGPDGHPYTLAELQHLATANSPALRQAAADVETAKGLMIQAGLYPNPTIGYTTAPNANNTSSTTLGLYFDQLIKTGGKLKIQTAVAKMNMVMAELALKRARYDLSTTIRGDYYSLLVARETVRVNKGLAHFTDEIYKLQADLLGGGFAASHEPAALRSQAFTVRLAYKQSIANYIYSWKQLVADMGLRQLPLSVVEGEVDRLIPFYDYDAVRAYVLRNHTDVLTAQANLEGSKYGLKLAQVTPIPDVEVNAGLFKEHQIQPFQNYYQITLSIPLALWDRNQGGIRAASAGLVRAAEGPHATEVALTTGLASAYGDYKSNLAAVEYYRNNILPDQVRYYRGVFERRKIDPNASFGDLVQAQQTLVADVTAYLGVLGTLWSSVVSVADYLQTDDLFQLGGTLELPQLPDFDAHPLPCPHPQTVLPPARIQPTPTPNPNPIPVPAPVPNAEATAAPTAKMSSTQGQQMAMPSPMGITFLLAPTTDPGQPDGDWERKLLALELPLDTPSHLSVLSTMQPSERFAPALSQRFSAASL